jgi:cytoskeletal protein RodZ
MASFGQELKKAREAKRVTLESISAATKITVRHLEALEQERFDQLPGGVFRRNIVRSYAGASGLDEDTWVERYLDAAHEEKGFREDDQAWIEFAENVGRSRGRSDDQMYNARIRWAGVAALLLLVLGMGWFVWGYVHARASAATVKTPGISSALNSGTGAGAESGPGAGPF